MWALSSEVDLLLWKSQRVIFSCRRRSKVWCLGDSADEKSAGCTAVSAAKLWHGIIQHVPSWTPLELQVSGEAFFSSKSSGSSLSVCGARVSSSLHIKVTSLPWVSRWLSSWSSRASHKTRNFPEILIITKLGKIKNWGIVDWITKIDWMIENEYLIDFKIGWF